jgi:hypothetical protein
MRCVSSLMVVCDGSSPLHCYTDTGQVANPRRRILPSVSVGWRESRGGSRTSFTYREPTRDGNAMVSTSQCTPPLKRSSVDGHFDPKEPDRGAISHFSTQPVPGNGASVETSRWSSSLSCPQGIVFVGRASTLSVWSSISSKVGRRRNVGNLEGSRF